MTLIPRTLFGRTATTIALALFLFMAISLGSMMYFIALPMAKRSADDFAALLLTGARSFQGLTVDERPALQQQLLLNHGLIVTTQTPALSEKKFDRPYYLFFRAALQRRTGKEIAIIESALGPLIWVDIPVDGSTVRMGFDRQRVTTNPSVLLILVLAGGLLLTVLTSFLLVRRIVGPLARLSSAVRAVGHGRNPSPLMEDGPAEMATLARELNRMSSEIQELVENRTVIVADVSHALQAPLTRLGLGVETLSKDTEPELIAGIRRDISAMDSLTGQFLQFSRGLSESQPESLDLWQLLEAQSIDMRRQGTAVELVGNGSCPYVADSVALQRILANLMDNAAHYGNGESITVELQCDERAVSIEIRDRGPGIPADQVEAVFRPFNRLETARGSGTGGSGLGLAIVRQLANKHGWTVELLPHEGGGTVAKLTLSAAQRP